MKTIYVADDGTQFNNEYECENYEFQKSIDTSLLIALDQDKKNIKLNKKTIENCYYVKIFTEKDLENFNKLCDYIGLCCLSYVGEFYYDCYDWVDLNMKIENLEEELDKLKEAKEIFNKSRNL